MELLPPKNADLETTKILKKLIEANKNLAELKGVSKTIPNQRILINTLAIQEAMDSSEIENIITTRDQVYIAKDDQDNNMVKTATKEVLFYVDALQSGFNNFLSHGIISLKEILNIQEVLVNNDAGIRKQAGTVLANERTGEVVYIPPEPNEIPDLMSNLISIINNDSDWDVDSLVKMAVIHYQFESIHPFYDGNGRTGRILNILYLVKEGLLDLPILYLSRYINQNKEKYYKFLQNIRTNNDWESYVLFMLEGISRTAKLTTNLVNEIVSGMMAYKHEIRSQFPSMYSQDLINSLFNYPYTKITHLENTLHVSYLTARKYLEQLAAIGLLTKERIGKTNYYINNNLFAILTKIESNSLKI